MHSSSMKTVHTRLDHLWVQLQRRRAVGLSMAWGWVGRGWAGAHPPRRHPERAWRQQTGGRGRRGSSQTTRNHRRTAGAQPARRHPERAWRQQTGGKGRSGSSQTTRKHRRTVGAGCSLREGLKGRLWLAGAQILHCKWGLFVFVVMRRWGGWKKAGPMVRVMVLCGLACVKNASRLMEN